MATRSAQLVHCTKLRTLSFSLVFSLFILTNVASTMLLSKLWFTMARKTKLERAETGGRTGWTSAKLRFPKTEHETLKGLMM